MVSPISGSSAMQSRFASLQPRRLPVRHEERDGRLLRVVLLVAPPSSEFAQPRTSGTPPPVDQVSAGCFCVIGIAATPIVLIANRNVLSLDLHSCSARKATSGVVGSATGSSFSPRNTGHANTLCIVEAGEGRHGQFAPLPISRSPMHQQSFLPPRTAALSCWDKECTVGRTQKPILDIETRSQRRLAKGSGCIDR